MLYFYFIVPSSLLRSSPVASHSCTFGSLMNNYSNSLLLRNGKAVQVSDTTKSHACTFAGYTKLNVIINKHVFVLV